MTLLLPGALVVLFAFNAGGFFPGAPAMVSVGLAVILAVRLLLRRTLAPVTPMVALCIGALALYAGWTLASASWSHSSWRAVVEYDRSLLYLLVLLLFASVGTGTRDLKWMVRGLGLGIFVVCAAALTSRLLPDLVSTPSSYIDNRLSYPVTYWNTLGLLAAIGTILALYLTTSRDEPRSLRVIGAALAPIFLTTLFFTFSRGANLGGAVGLVTYIGFARPKSLVGGLSATVPASIPVLIAAYNSEALVGDHPTGRIAVAQGHHVAFVLVISVILAGAVRALILVGEPRFDRLRQRLRVPPQHRRQTRTAIGVTVVIALLTTAAAVDAPSYLSHQFDRFVSGQSPGTPGDPKTRLTDPAGKSRLELWDVALKDGFEPEKLAGQGAGTFQLVWAKNRDVLFDGNRTARDAHSLYVETLSDLGIVGLVLVLVFVGAALGGLIRLIPGPDRCTYAALTAIMTTWVIHAGIDWDWEMPVATAWVFAIGGAALAKPSARPKFTLQLGPSRTKRVVLAAAVLALAVTPARIAVSQWQLDVSFDAFAQDDCPRAIDSALDSASTLDMRPDPFEIIGYCDSRLDRSDLAIPAMMSAIQRDPMNWRLRYGLAVVQGAAGLDPRAAAQDALRLNPLGPLPRDLARRTRTSSPTDWKRAADRAVFPGAL